MAAELLFVFGTDVILGIFENLFLLGLHLAACAERNSPWPVFFCLSRKPVFTVSFRGSCYNLSTAETENDYSIRTRLPRRDCLTTTNKSCDFHWSEKERERVELEGGGGATIEESDKALIFSTTFACGPTEQLRLLICLWKNLPEWANCWGNSQHCLVAQELPREVFFVGIGKNSIQK